MRRQNEARIDAIRARKSSRHHAGVLAACFYDAPYTLGGPLPAKIYAFAADPVSFAN